MKVLVTGANGHIGSHTVRYLLEFGHEVTALVRESSNIESLDGLAISIVKGDVTDAASIEKAVEGCDVIVHLAAVYKTWAANPEDIIEPAVKGAETIFKAAKQSGVKRVIYTSSMAAVGVSKSPTPRNETDYNEDARNPYYVAKTESEKVAQRLAKEADIELIILCPAMVVGPLDYRITPSTELICSMANFKLPYLMTYQGGTNIVDVRDVAFVHAKAVDLPGIGGERFIIGSDNVQSRDIGELIKELTGTSYIHAPFSRGLMLFTMGISEFFSNLFRIKPLVPKSLVYENVGRWAWYDCEKTYRTFNYTPKSFRETIIASLEWLEEQGKLRPKAKQHLRSQLTAQQQA